MGLNPTNHISQFWKIFSKKSENYEPTNLLCKTEKFMDVFFVAISWSFLWGNVFRIYIGTESEN